MGRGLAISAGMVAALVVTAVAIGAGDVRIHRLHLPPPPVGDALGGEQPSPPDTTPPPTRPAGPAARASGTAAPAAAPAFRRWLHDGGWGDPGRYRDARGLHAVPHADDVQLGGDAHVPRATTSVPISTRSPSRRPVR